MKSGKTSGGRGGVVYVVAFGNRVKVGYTAQLWDRLPKLETQTGRPAEILLVLDSPCRIRPLRLEREIHRALAPFRVRGEWYLASREMLAALPIAVYDVLIHEGAA